MLKYAGRLGDRSHPSRSHAATASANVLINRKPALRDGDVGEAGWSATEGAPYVLINGRRVHRAMDRHSSSCLAEGSRDCIVGDAHGSSKNVTIATAKQVSIVCGPRTVSECSDAKYCAHYRGPVTDADHPSTQWEVVDEKGAPLDPPPVLEANGRFLTIIHVSPLWAGRTLKVRAYLHTTRKESEGSTTTDVILSELGDYIRLVQKIEESYTDWDDETVLNALLRIAGCDTFFFHTLLGSREGRPIPVPERSGVEDEDRKRLVALSAHKITAGLEKGIAWDSWAFPVAMGHVLTGLAAGRHGRWLPRLDPIYAVTIAGDVGQTALDAIQKAAPLLGELTEAELVGDIDGFRIGKSGGRPDTKISVVLHDYYCKSKINTTEPRAIERIAKSEDMMGSPPWELRRQSIVFAIYFSTAKNHDSAIELAADTSPPFFVKKAIDDLSQLSDLASLLGPKIDEVLEKLKPILKRMRMQESALREHLEKPCVCRASHDKGKQTAASADTPEYWRVVDDPKNEAEGKHVHRAKYTDVITSDMVSLADRKHTKLERAKNGDTTVPLPAGWVRALKQDLRTFGFWPGDDDNDTFTDITRHAVMSFQFYNLGEKDAEAADGVVGDQTKLWIKQWLDEQRINTKLDDVRMIAGDLLAFHPRTIFLKDVHQTTPKDKATAYWNVLYHARGNYSMTSTTAHVGERPVRISTAILDILLDLGRQLSTAGISVTHEASKNAVATPSTEQHVLRKIQINEITGAQHSKGSRHYSGRAVDVGVHGLPGGSKLREALLDFIKADGGKMQTSREWLSGDHIHFVVD